MSVIVVSHRLSFHPGVRKSGLRTSTIRHGFPSHPPLGLLQNRRLVILVRHKPLLHGSLFVQLLVHVVLVCVASNWTSKSASDCFIRIRWHASYFGWHNVEVIAVRPSERTEYYVGIHDFDWRAFYGNHFLLIPTSPVFAYYIGLAYDPLYRLLL